MRLARSFGFVTACLALAVGCAAEDDGSDRNWDPELNASKANGSCAPQTCRSAGKTCGTHDDGCGGSIDCGKCVANGCEPKSCQDLGKTCGKQDDGCGGSVDCGKCSACPPDSKAGNNAAEKAADLGAMTDSPTTHEKFEALSLGENEEDWFKFSVTDAGFMGNPRIKATVTGAALEVSAFYLCNADENDSECPVTGEAPDATVGKGCKGKGTATVTTYCSSTDETGTAFVRVKTANAAQQCVSYTLDIAIDEAW